MHKAGGPQRLLVPEQEAPGVGRAESREATVQGCSVPPPVLPLPSPKKLGEAPPLG